MTATDPAQDRLYRDADLAAFYDLDNGWGLDLDYCAALARDSTSVLDLGCGTGQLAACLADHRTVFGVDPAESMLEVARWRPGGRDVTWVCGDARTVRLSRKFDLVVLTGHAFQVLLTDDDQSAALATIAAHLAPKGRFIFDSRNPAARAWRDWGPEDSYHLLDHPELGPVEAWNDAAHDETTGIVTYETHYRIVDTGREFSATSKIRFSPRDHLERLLDRAGLAVEQWLGEWEGSPSTETSPEFIPLGRLA